MFVHTLIIAVHVAVVAAFIILWYYWVKRKLGASLFIDDEDQILFPFRYFSWLFVGLILVTSLIQVHFVRVSATVHERLATLAPLAERQEMQAKATESTREMVQKLRSDVDLNFKGVRTQIAEFRASLQSAGPSEAAHSVQAGGPLRKPALANVMTSQADGGEKDFGRAAKASRRLVAAVPPPAHAKAPGKPESETYRMPLSRTGRVLTNNLRVRKRPELQATVVDKLMAGQEVKVTEKLMADDKVWFRVVTPTGRAGWIDFRYVKLASGS